MIYLLSAVLAVILVEMVLRSPILSAVGRMGAAGSKAVRTISSPRISDHWKERALLRYARDILFGSGLILASMAAIAAVIVIADRASEAAGAPGLMRTLFTWRGILVVTAAASVYAAIRAALRADPATGGYGFWARLLHRLALGNGAIAEASFSAEQALGKFDPGLVVDGRHVFVSGLARAGTTVLMRRFHGTGLFRSLTYRDMPFVLAPNLWRRISGGSQRRMDRVERAHGDGVLVDYDSPEALDEVFWRVFRGEDYIFSDHLAEMEADPEDIDRLRRYVAGILEARENCDWRYLSKNNNNILRLGAIRAAFPNALIVIPFRAPVDQAASLLRQHQRFAAEGAADPFIRRYMTWLVHHEFGADHRPFRMGESAPLGEPESLDYWLALWRAVYGRLEETAPTGAVFLSYEALCRDPQTVWGRLCALTGIEVAKSEVSEPLELRSGAANGSADAALMADCAALHARLLVRMEVVLS